MIQVPQSLYGGSQGDEDGATVNGSVASSDMSDLGSPPPQIEVAAGAGAGKAWVPRNQGPRRRPGRNPDPLPTGWENGGASCLSGSLADRMTSRKRSYKRTVFNPDWSSINHKLLQYTNQKNQVFMKKKLNLTDVKTLKDYVGLALFKPEDWPADQKKFFLDGVMAVVYDPKSGEYKKVMAMQASHAA